jgi:hypothetical protein
MMLTAIPTRYRGVQFRSRLEARWAAFFDIAGWRWQYEPIDLDGWIPDFRLCGKVPALCEVKPIDFGGFTGTLRDSEKAFNRIRSAAPNVINIRNQFHELRVDDAKQNDCSELFDHEIIVLGLGPAPSQMMDDNGYSIPLFGYMLHEHVTGCADWTVICAGYEPQHLDYIAVETRSWRYRIGGQSDESGGKDHLQFIKDCDVEDLWREAGNFVQWKAPA